MRHMKKSMAVMGLSGVALLAACQMHPVNTNVCGNRPTDGIWQEKVKAALLEQLPMPYGDKMEAPSGKIKPYPQDVRYDFGSPHRYIINSDRFFSRPVKEAGYTVFIRIDEKLPDNKWQENSRYYCFLHNDLVTGCERVHAAEPWKLTHLGIILSDEYPKK
ncbi:hypothetical protein FAI41_05495 [Acetobacteraceae bacterium]|nr:hypothetical protein FAI41_05495 [Acetobacteraceae bacterium]